jgi:hypothetical protein
MCGKLRTRDGAANKQLIRGIFCLLKMKNVRLARTVMIFGRSFYRCPYGCIGNRQKVITPYTMYQKQSRDRFS